MFLSAEQIEVKGKYLVDIANILTFMVWEKEIVHTNFKVLE